MVLIKAIDTERDVVEVVRISIMPPNATPAELQFYMAWCRMRQVDPVSQAFVIRQSGKLVPGITIAGMRAIAARSGKYGPQDGPYWLDRGGDWLDVWTDDEPPVAARVGVKQTDWDGYTYGTATWREFGAAKAGQNFSPWKTQPANMLAIRAEANALRRAFPADLAGMYVKEELQEGGGTESITLTTGTPASQLVGARVWDEETGEHLGDVIDARGDPPTPIKGKRMTAAQAQRIAKLLLDAGITGEEKGHLLASYAGTTDYRKMTEHGAQRVIDQLEASLRAEAQRGGATDTDEVVWEGNVLSEADWEAIEEKDAGR